VKAMLWHPIACLAWAQPATVWAGTTGESAALASVRSVVVDSASQCDGGYDIEGAALSSFHSVDFGSVSHCGGGHDI
jgi:hypothetical protein